MTKEEIEKQAEERFYKTLKQSNTFFADIVDEELALSLFKDGAKWGMEHAIQWHDLRKNPEDLPKCAENKQIIFYVKEYNTDIEKDTSHFCLGFFAKSFMNDDLKVFVEKSKGYECEHLSQEVIKWCELPQFKE